MQDTKQIYQLFSQEISPFTFHNQELTRILFIALMTHSSILIEDLPGVGKTTLSKALAKLMGLEMTRIQGTSDLLPQDILGGEYYDFDDKTIKIKKGPIFTQLLLIDEINRMNPKTQSAFLQAMEEKCVHLAGKIFPLSEHFLVIATQNPIEHLGTFPLPEAQKDRFGARISLARPSDTQMLDLIMNHGFSKIEDSLQKIKPIATNETMNQWLGEILAVGISEDVAKRLMRFFQSISENQYILYPLSQRGISLFLLACRASACIESREFMIPSDGEALVIPFLAHRLEIEQGHENILLNLYKKAFSFF